MTPSNSSQVVDPLDITKAQSMNEQDRDVILGKITGNGEDVGKVHHLVMKGGSREGRRGPSSSVSPPKQVNSLLRSLMSGRMLDALLRHALKSGDHEGARVLVEEGAKVNSLGQIPVVVSAPPSLSSYPPPSVAPLQLYCGSLMMSGIKFGGDVTTAVLGEVGGDQELWIFLLCDALH